jgi:hypothetical protein
MMFVKVYNIVAETIVLAARAFNLLTETEFITIYHGELVSKPPLRPNFFVGERISILKINHIFLRLNSSLRRDLRPD